MDENSGDDKKKDKKHRDRRHKSDVYKKSKRGDDVIKTGEIENQKLEEENAKLKAEVTEIKNKLDHLETKERNKETRITLLMRELEKLESRVLECQEDCLEWEQIDREKDKIVLSLQQTVVILQRDLERITEGGEIVVVAKNPKSNTGQLNFVAGHTKHEYPPESPSDSDNSASSDSEAEELPIKRSRSPQQSPATNEENTSPSSSPPCKPPSPSGKPPSKQPSAPLLTAKKSSALGFDSSTDIFAMMAGGAAPAATPQSTSPPQPAPSTSKVAKFGFDSRTDIFSMMARTQQDVLKADDSSSSSDSDDEVSRSPTTPVGSTSGNTADGQAVVKQASPQAERPLPAPKAIATAAPHATTPQVAPQPANPTATLAPQPAKPAAALTPQPAKPTASNNGSVRWGKPAPGQVGKPAPKSAQVGPSSPKPVAPSSSNNVQPPPPAATLKPTVSVRKLAAMWEQPSQSSLTKPAGRPPIK